jgi:hypothetical protein
MRSTLLYGFIVVVTFVNLLSTHADFLPEVPDAYTGDSTWLQEELLELPEYVPRSDLINHLSDFYELFTILVNLKF